MTLGRLLLLFTVVPLGELLVLVEIGQRIGAGATVLLVLATGVLGAWLARREGARSVRQIQAELSSGSVPARELFHGLLILLAGAFLVTPGVLTDLVGFVLLVRPARTRVIAWLRSYLEGRIVRGGGSWSASRGVFFTFGTGTGSEHDGGRREGPRRPGSVSGGERTEGSGRREPGEDDDGNRRRIIEL